MDKNGKLSPNIDAKEMGKVANGFEIDFFVYKRKKPTLLSLSIGESDLLSSKLSLQEH